MEYFKFITLGCKVNAYESEALKELFVKEGYQEATNDEQVTIAVVNTCAVTHVAEHKSRQKVSSWRKLYPKAVIVVCGCSSQLHPSDYQNIAGTDIIIGNNNHLEVIDLIKKYKADKQQKVSVDKNTRLRTYQNLHITNFDEKIRAFVKIGDGCNNFCSYCIVPFSRGNLRSRDKNEIICEIKTLVENGYKEIVLSGIDLASYGCDLDNYTFDDLLDEILQIQGLSRLRISSIEASRISERFIDTLQHSKVLAPHLHIPLQSGSETVLRRMKRKYTCEDFYNKISLIRSKLPDIALACDVIVGFPGESEEEFNETYNFIKKCGFNFLHVFPYSKRTNTLAASLPDQILESVKKERVSKLISLGKELEKQYYDKFKGQELEILVESYDKKLKKYKGLTANYLEGFVESDHDIVNQFIKIIF